MKLDVQSNLHYFNDKRAARDTCYGSVWSMPIHSIISMTNGLHEIRAMVQFDPCPFTPLFQWQTGCTRYVLWFGLIHAHSLHYFNDKRAARDTFGSLLWCRADQQSLSSLWLSHDFDWIKQPMHAWEKQAIAWRKLWSCQKKQEKLKTEFCGQRL